MFLALTLTLSANTVSAVSQNQTNTVDEVQSTTQQANTDTTYQTKNSTEKTTTTNSTVTTSSTSKSSTSSKNTTSTNSKSQSAAGSAAGSTTTIKVLIYNGAYASTNCVSGLKTILTNANSNSLVSGVKFTYATTTKITSSILSGYDVLIMPGGDGGSYYLNSGSISASAIKNFVTNGGGYIGICAGAYAAVAKVDGRYNGWGIAPHVNAKVVSYVGNLAMQFTSAGTQLLDRSGNITVHHYNGAAMYTTSSTAKILATYADNKTGYKGYADIVSDYYGKGRSVLIGSHLELSPQYPDVLAKLIAWAADVSTSSTPTTTVSVSQIASAASSVKSFIENNQRLPNYVTISGKQVTMPQFLSLLTTGTIQVNSGSTAAITVKNVGSALNSTGNVESGNILKSEYLEIAQSIQSFINSNGRAPNYATTTLGKISYNSLIYTFSKVLNFYSTNNRLPNYVSVSNSSSSEGSSSSSNSSSSSGDNSTTQTVTLKQINSAASSVKSFIEGNQRLPNYVSISGKQVTMSEFLSLLTTGTIQINSGSTAAITVKNVDSAPNSTENVKSGNILKSEYLEIAQSIQSFINSNGRAPNYATTSLGKISYDSLIYTFSRVLNFYSTNNRLPNYVSVTPWKGSLTGSPSQSEGDSSEGGSNTGVLRPVYIVSDIIQNSVKDNALINSIVSALSKLGITAYNYGVGSQAHLNVLSNENVPKNALIVEIFGGADAGVIYEKGTTWYKNLLGAGRKDFLVFYNTATKITGLTWLPRAHDDNYSSSSFKGIANPDQYLTSNGYNYFEGLTTSNISELVQILYEEATS